MALLDATSKIATVEVDEDVGIPYSCCTHHHIATITLLSVVQTLVLETLLHC
jgi:hypothetical protein